ncbi:MAG: T9SS type A sorting domain-containing protein [Bacteroidetes bacterium]|nr:T9SS type A sorting domain-containing protein [Bacteroidota bacterium]
MRFSLLMIATCHLLPIVIGTNICHAQSGTWVAVYGGEQYDRGRGIAQTFDKGYIVCGPSSSYGMGNTDFYLLKIDSAGKYQWQNTFGGINIENCFSVEQTKDSGFVICGYTNSFGAGGYDAYLVKTNSLGILQWEKTFGGSDWDFAYWAEQTNDGGYILCGETYSFGNNSQAYLVKTNSAGNLLWEKNFGISNKEAGKEVHQTFDNGYIFAGYITNDGGDANFYLVKTDSAGTKKWEKNFGGAGDDICNSVALCADGGFLLGGHSVINGTEKFHFMKTTSTGAVVFSNTDAPSSSNKSITRIRETDDDTIVFIMNSDIGGLGGQEIVLLKYEIMWSWFPFVHTFGGINDDEGYDFVQTADSGYALVGFTATFGTGPDNIFIAKTNRNGDYNTSINSFVSVNEISEKEDGFLIYPNPSNGRLHISNSKFQASAIRIYNLVGQNIFQSENIVYNSEVNISSLPQGVYLLEILFEEGIAREKIIISK